MCNLYNIKATRAEFNAYFSSTDDWRHELAVEKDYVSPSRPGFVVREADGTRLLGAMSWGFPPPPGVKSAVVNVRNYASPFWRTALAKPERRCLVPVTEFQEWSVEPDPLTGKKTKHWFAVPSRSIFAFAGVWRSTEQGAAYAFLTCGYDGDPAGHVVGAIHPKAMPVILHEEDFDRWLQSPIDEAIPLACAFPSQLLSVG